MGSSVEVLNVLKKGIVIWGEVDGQPGTYVKVKVTSDGKLVVELG